MTRQDADPFLELSGTFRECGRSHDPGSAARTSHFQQQVTVGPRIGVLQHARIAIQLDGYAQPQNLPP
jgi:hypothetical protein